MSPIKIQKSLSSFSIHNKIRKSSFHFEPRTFPVLQNLKKLDEVNSFSHFLQSRYVQLHQQRRTTFLKFEF